MRTATEVLGASLIDNLWSRVQKFRMFVGYFMYQENGEERLGFFRKEIGHEYYLVHLFHETEKLMEAVAGYLTLQGIVRLSGIIRYRT